MRSDGVPEVEYDEYLNVLASKLRRGSGRADIAHYLTVTPISATDVTVPPAWAEKCERTAQELLAWYQESSAPRNLPEAS